MLQSIIMMLLLFAYDKANRCVTDWPFKTGNWNTPWNIKKSTLSSQCCSAANAIPP